MASIYRTSAPYHQNPLILSGKGVQQDQSSKKESRYSLLLVLYGVGLLINELFQLEIGLFVPVYLLVLITFHVLMMLRKVFRAYLEEADLPYHYLLFGSIANVYAFSLLSFCYRLSSDNELLYWLSSTAAMVSLLQTIVYIKTSTGGKVERDDDIV